MTLDIKKQILNIYDETQQDYEAILLTGSGTSAVEAMVDSFVPEETKALVISNGVYGERIATMLKRQKKKYKTICSKWADTMNLEKVEQVLREDEQISYVISVHHETTTGRLNDLAALAQICKKHNKKLLLDAVSSFAGELIEFKKWNISALAATANKCLHGVPGISFVVAHKELLEQKSSNSTSVYLDLFSYYKHQKNGFSPYTQSVQVMYALQEALAELHETGGWKKRHSQYLHRSEIIRNGLLDLNYTLLIENIKDHSCVLTAYNLPENLEYSAVHKTLKENGYIIYAGQGNFAKKIFRISTMGNLTDDDLRKIIQSFKIMRN
jgi:2-aminoethylphosphonate-pyruvate transaminase